MLNAVPNGKILTLPAGVYEWSNFLNSGNGYWDGIKVPSNVGGIYGSGTGQTILRMKANTSTIGGNTAVIPPSSGTNQANLISFYGSGCQVNQLQFQGTPQGHYYNGVAVAGGGAGSPITGVTFSDVWFNGCAPGYAGQPPGETFMFSTYYANNTSCYRCEFSGLNPQTGAGGYAASPCGWNNSTNAYLEDCYFHDCAFSTLTFWQTTGIHTLRCTVKDCATAIPAALINHENVAGAVLHDQLQLLLTHPSDYAGNHVSLANGTYPNNTNVTFSEPSWSALPGDNGMLNVDIANGYVDANGHAQTQTSAPTVVKAGRTLVAVGSSGVASGSATRNYVLYH